MTNLKPDPQIALVHSSILKPALTSPKLKRAFPHKVSVTARSIRNPLRTDVLVLSNAPLTEFQATDFVARHTELGRKVWSNLKALLKAIK